MLKTENFIVVGKCFIACKVDQDIIKLKDMITTYLAKSNYYPLDRTNVFFQDGFLSMKFINNVYDTKVPFRYKLGNSLGFMNKKDVYDKLYLKGLREKAYDVPFVLTLNLSMQKSPREGFIIEIRSEPAILFHDRNLNLRHLLDDFKYSKIWNSGKQLINDFMFGINAQILEPPEVLDKEYHQTLAFPKDLEKKLSKDFEVEIKDLKFVYGKSGNCTAFILRRILEKALWLVFARNNLKEKITDGKFSKGLQDMINTAHETKIKDTPILSRKNKDNLSGIKFLGDSSGHEFSKSVEMEYIIPQIPYIIYALEELSNKIQ